MLPAMKAALTDPRAAATPSFLRQVVFLTDGAIGNEQQLLDTIAAIAAARGCSWSASARRRTPS